MFDATGDRQSISDRLLVQEAVAQMLAYNEWFQAQVQIGIEQIARGEFIEEEEMDARVERMLRY